MWLEALRYGAVNPVRVGGLQRRVRVHDKRLSVHPHKPRDYKKEYRDFHGKPEQIKRRAARNKSRALIAQEPGGNSLLAGKDVDHKDRNPENTSRKNLRVQTKAKNRSRNSHKKT